MIHTKKHHEWNGEKGWYLLWRGVFKGRGTCTIVTNLIHSLLSTKFSVSYRSLQEQSTSLCRKVRDFHSLQFVGTDRVLSEKNIQVKKLPVHILFFYVILYILFSRTFLGVTHKCQENNFKEIFVSINLTKNPFLYILYFF